MSIYSLDKGNRDSITNDTISRYLDNNLYTAMPAKILKISDYNSQQTVDVQPLIDSTTDDYVALAYPVLETVPLIFPSGGGGLLSFPVAVGDTVLLLFCKEPISDWLISDGSEQSSPEIFDKFRIIDAVAISGLYTLSSNLNPDPNNVVLKFAGSTVTLYKNGNATVSAAATATVTAAQDINLNAVGNVNITAGGNVNVSGATINLN